MMRKLMDSVPFLTLFLCVSAVMCGVYYTRQEWVWLAVWAVAVPWDGLKLKEAIYTRNGRYKKPLSTCMAQSAIAILAAFGAIYNCVQSNFIVALACVPASVFYGMAAYRTLKAAQRLMASDARLDNWLAAHFPDDDMSDIKLERK